MTTATTTKITLTDLAQAVNHLIETQPDRINPKNGYTCVYHDPKTNQRCLVGQALYNLTGLNVPVEFEDNSIDMLLDRYDFRSLFGLEDPEDYDLFSDLTTVQGHADHGYEWGSLTKIEVGG